MFADKKNTKWRPRQALCVWDDILTASSDLGKNEDSLDCSINDGSDAASDSDVPVNDGEEDNVLEDVDEPSPGDVVNNYHYDMVRSSSRPKHHGNILYQIKVEY